MRLLYTWNIAKKIPLNMYYKAQLLHILSGILSLFTLPFGLGIGDNSSYIIVKYGYDMKKKENIQ